MSIKIEKPKNSKKHRGVRFSDDEWEELKSIAEDQDVSISAVIRHATKVFVEKCNSAKD